jgi:hypothetical protein
MSMKKIWKAHFERNGYKQKFGKLIHTQLTFKKPLKILTTSRFRDNTVWNYKNNVTASSDPLRDIIVDLSRGLIRAKVNALRLADATHVSLITDFARVGQTLYTRGG